MIPNNLKISNIFHQLVKSDDKDHISFGEILDIVSDKGFNVLMVIFALPSIIPIPGLSTITGIPLIIISLQMMFGYKKPKLPDYIKSKTINYEVFKKLIISAIKYLERFEKIFRPRIFVLTTSLCKRMLGIMLLVSSLILTLPIVFANAIPTISIILISIGCLYRDGVMIIIGIIASIISVIIALCVIFIGFEAIDIFIKTIF